MSQNTVAAVVVCFNPPDGLEQRLQAIARQVDWLIIWDNASDQMIEVPVSLSGKQTVLARSDSNLGIAAALNLGLAKAKSLGATYGVLFDHDSSPAEGMVAKLLTTINQATEPTAAAVPRIRYALPDIQCRWPQTQASAWHFKFVYADQTQAPASVDLAISSGMLLDLNVWQELGGFDESLFIDLVDTEYCLLARQHGYQVLANPAANLQHSLGEVDRKRLAGLTLYPTHHSAIRHYFINRNRWILTGRYGLRFPAWLAYEWLGAAKLLFKTVLFEPQRGRKLAAMLKGNLHGLQRLFSNAPAVRSHNG